MARGRGLLATGFVLLLTLNIACSGPAEEEAVSAHDVEEWAWLQEAKQNLDGKRSELTKVKDIISGKITYAEAHPSADGEEVEAPSAEELAQHATDLKTEVEGLTQDFMTRLVPFINNMGIVEGAELTDVQLGALRMNSSEAMVTAQEYIDEGGDFQRAIDIYTQTLLNDPENQGVKDALAQAEAQRYMTEERFAVVKKKMTQNEVRNLLGTVNHRNVREYDEGVVAWFYRKSDGGAAGVFFKEAKGEQKVYKTDFGAIKPPQERAAEGE